MSAATPKSWQSRRAVYARQNNGSKTMTPAQSRRDRHERNEAKGKRSA